MSRSGSALRSKFDKTILPRYVNLICNLSVLIREIASENRHFNIFIRTSSKGSVVRSTETNLSEPVIQSCE